MAGRARDTRNRKPTDAKTTRSIPSTLPLFPTPEEESFCDAVARVCPGINGMELLQALRKEAAKRCNRVRQLREQVVAGEYQVPPGAVAAAILAEGELLVQ